jgi:hypothetical protein
VFRDVTRDVYDTLMAGELDHAATGANDDEAFDALIRGNDTVR